MIRSAAMGIVVALLTACGSAAPSEPAPDWAAIEPGHPFDGQAILAAMRESRRPGGVPDEIETAAIAADIAGTVTTFDGEPWTTVSIGGSCGPAICTLDVSGGRADAVGEDLWTFSIEPATGQVSVLDAQLGSIPRDLLERADRTARASSLRAQLAGMVIGSVSWLPPPDGRLVLAYRSGEEEGSCQRDVSVHPTSGSVEVVREVDC